MTYFKNIFEKWRALYDARHEPESLRPLAEAFWRALLSLAALCVGGVLVYGVSEFVGVLDRLSSGGSGSGSPPVVLDRKQLETTLDAFDARTSYSNSSHANITAADPSR